ncbi:MAG: AAA family ATPase [Sutterella sp.]|nr:AAA family ATPase [Sutterella sp.]
MSDLLLTPVPAARFGLPADTFSACLGYATDSLPVFSRTRIPVVNPRHFFTLEHCRTLSLWWRLSRGEPLYISGPSGSGKTSTALQFCARLGMPVVSVTARARMDRRELIGHWSVRGGETVWVDGPALLAWKFGWVLLINEFSAAPADMWVSCNDILEGLPIDNEATGLLVERHPMTRVIVTDNTRGHSAEIDDGFFGRQIQDRSVIDRFWHLRMEGLAEADEARLLEAETPEHLRAVHRPETLARLCRALAKAGADSRAAARTQAIGFESHAVPLSFRTLTRLRDMILASAAEGGESGREGLLRLVRTAFTEALDSTARETAETLLVTAIGRIPGDLRRSVRASSDQKEAA